MAKRGQKTETAPIKWNQAKTLITCAMEDEKYNTALMLASGIYFGLRIGDILQLTWQQILSDHFAITEGKTQKVRKIDVHKDFKKLASRVGRLCNISEGEDRLVFTHQRSDGNQERPITVVAANKRIKRAFEEYGIETQNPSSHTLRKTFGRRVYENNHKSEAALVLLSQIFGHRDISTTRRYIGLTQEKIANGYLSL